MVAVAREAHTAATAEAGMVAAGSQTMAAMAALAAASLHMATVVIVAVMVVAAEDMAGARAAAALATVGPGQTAQRDVSSKVSQEFTPHSRRHTKRHHHNRSKFRYCFNKLEAPVLS